MVNDPRDPAAQEPARLSPEARRAVEQARAEPLSYAVRMFACPDVPRPGEHGEPQQPRLLVALGEAHLKLARASALGRAVVEQFELRGVETFQRDRVALGRLLGVLIHAPRAVLRALSLGLVKDSTIIDARQRAVGHTVQLEAAEVTPRALHAASVYLAAFFVVAWTELGLALARALLGAHGHGALELVASGLTVVGLAFEIHLLLLLPAWFLRRRSWAWLVHPAVGLVTVRDTLMADGTVRMLRDHPEPDAALVIMGRAHLPGYERELLARGFRRVG